MATYPTEPLPAPISELSWLAGQWTGTYGGDTIEEHWSEPGAGAMMGMFRWIREEQVRFYELMTLEPEGEGIVLRIKHFAPGLVGLEAQDAAVTLDLVDESIHVAIFHKRSATEQKWLIYRYEGEDAISAYFETAETTATEAEMFHYRRMPAPPGRPTLRIVPKNGR
jgi:hypothetical protein